LQICEAMPLARMPAITALKVHGLTIPTASPESDGTFEWQTTSMVLVEVTAGGETGIGWSYASRASAALIGEALAVCVRGADPFGTAEIWQRMVARCRNLGRPGDAMRAISAVDIAVWDLKARLMGLPLTALLPRERAAVPIYGSGGFTSYDQRQLCEQLAGWASQGIPRVKMKVGRDPEQDPRRVGWARAAVGDHTALFVDANGAYAREQAQRLGGQFAQLGVTWFEEPVSSDDLDGLRWLRERLPMDVAAGEDGVDPWACEAMLAAGAVDVLQVDATQCGGITGFQRACAIADDHRIAVSARCAPNLHAHLGCAAPRFAHVEYFYDHVRIEELLFEGALVAAEGCLRPDPSRRGLGLAVRPREVARHAQ
jgi:L-alanine-DL-glutamate epimerase-like enolase superfamily enzyme